MRKKIVVGVFFLMVIGVLGYLFMYSQSNPELKKAPPNPAFVKAMEDIRSGKFQYQPNMGYIPGPVDASHNVNPDNSIVHTGYASSYDMRTYGQIPPIKDQGSCGSCWAFGSYGSLESTLWPGEPRNFSELHLIRYHGFDLAECAGGSAYMASAYLMRWGGPYNTADYPYPYASIPADDLSLVQKHVQEVAFLPARTGPTDNDHVKYFLTYGIAVTFAFDYNAAYYNSSKKSYYEAATGVGSNHEICIIGWDDNYAASNFSTAPPGNGAFLCRNSWGTGWGNNGYFWMSYYNGVITELSVFLTVANPSDYKTIYQYDPFGWTASWGFETTTAWEANIFTATSNDPLKAIAYWRTDYCNSHYYIYKNPTPGNPTSGTLMTSGTDIRWLPGIKVIPITSVPLSTGDTFSVVVQFVNQTNTYPMAVEEYRSGYDSAITNAPGRSFNSYDGTTWNDWCAQSSNAYKIDNCIKAYTGAGVSNLKNDFDGDGKEEILWRNNGSTGQNAVWYLATVPASPEMMAAAGGTVKMLGAPKASRDLTLAAPPLFPPDNGLTARARGEAMRFDAQEGAALTARTGSWNPNASRPLQTQSLRTLSTPAGGASIQTIPMRGYSFLNTVADLNYQIVGTGDFNGDGYIDILWRNVSTGQNAVWYMSGITYIGYASLNSMTDLTWQIVGTGDFNGDGKVDILWRNSSTGQNAVWFMNGAVYSSYAYLMSCTDLSWKIVATGDFNFDDKVDILYWNASTGKSVVWYMNGATYAGYNYLDSYVADTNWRIAGVGDFNMDQKPDIVWRNYSTGQNAVWYMDGYKYKSTDFLNPISDMNWVIVNR